MTPSELPLDGFIRVPDAADVLGIHRVTAYELIARDEFPVPVVKLGRAYRVPVAPLRRLMNTGAAS